MRVPALSGVVSLPRWSPSPSDSDQKVEAGSLQLERSLVAPWEATPATLGLPGAPPSGLLFYSSLSLRLPPLGGGSEGREPVIDPGHLLIRLVLSEQASANTEEPRAHETVQGPQDKLCDAAPAEMAGPRGLPVTWSSSTWSHILSWCPASTTLGGN